jgi:hypothetical protein
VDGFALDRQVSSAELEPSEKSLTAMESSSTIYHESTPAAPADEKSGLEGAKARSVLLSALRDRRLDPESGLSRNQDSMKNYLRKLSEFAFEAKFMSGQLNESAKKLAKRRSIWDLAKLASTVHVLKISLVEIGADSVAQDAAYLEKLFGEDLRLAEMDNLLKTFRDDLVDLIAKVAEVRLKAAAVVLREETGGEADETGAEQREGERSGLRRGGSSA